MAYTKAWITPPPSETGGEHDLQTPMGADYFWHVRPHTRQLLVLLHTMRQRDFYDIEGATEMSKEALQIALKELENCTTWHLTREQFDKNVTAIKVIKQALAAPAQEIVCSTGLCHYKPAAPDLQAELDATNRQVEILSDALAESRREVAALKELNT